MGVLIDKERNSDEKADCTAVRFSDIISGFLYFENGVHDNVCGDEYGGGDREDRIHRAERYAVTEELKVAVNGVLYPFDNLGRKAACAHLGEGSAERMISEKGSAVRSGKERNYALKSGSEA